MTTPCPRPSQRRFLFLQGPPGPFFLQLARALAAQGAQVQRILLNGGDEYDWPADTCLSGHKPTCFRAPATRWPLFVDKFLRENAITDLVLFGDCRPLHLVAHQMARISGVAVHVFEEGYIRPNWLTLERDGVNGHSSLPRGRDAVLAAAQGLAMPAPQPAIGASLGRRTRDTWGYFRHMVWGCWRYPFYKSHRPGSIIMEGFGWVYAQAMKARRAAQTAATLAKIDTLTAAGQRYFLFPLQLSSDYQIRVHSPFASMKQAADYVLASFAADAPADALLVIKEHPLDFASWGRWRAYVADRARRLGLEGRLLHLAGGDLNNLALGAQGMVVVNSTSATFALAGGIPVKALGTAVYAMEGITDTAPLARFWQNPTPPDPALWDAFARVLHNTCLIRGGLASQSATTILIEGAVSRLLGVMPGNCPPQPKAIKQL